MPDSQPRILSLSQDAFGRTVVVDTEGTTILEPTPRAGSTFGVNVSWGGGQAEIRWSSEDDQNNNRSLVHIGLYGKKNDGYTTWGTGSFLMRGAGDGWSGWYVSVTGSWTHLAQRDVWIGHDAAGYGSAEIGVVQGEIIGTSCNNIWGTQWHAFTNYTVLPYAPQTIQVRPGTVQTTSFGVEWVRNSHDGIDQEEAQWSLNSGFSSIVWTDTLGGGGNGTWGYSNPADKNIQLTPGTLHYVRVRSHTGRGWGPWSNTVSQTTLPAVPPGLTVVAQPAGTSAVLSFTPPGGVTGVTKYKWFRRVQGQTTETTGETATTPKTVSGLTPGTIYEWRATAFIGTYESPTTGWIAVQQPNPNTSPGDYFDGDTTDKPDIDYAWTGADGGSSSVAKGKKVTGWEVPGGSITGGGVAVMHQTTGGATLDDGSTAGDFAARVIWHADTTAPGAEFGTENATSDAADVVPNGTYTGSIYVNPSRAQRLAARIRFYDAAGTAASNVLGDPQLLPANVWTRLSVVAVAPANAQFAAVRAVDVAGDGWSAWLGGETLLLDAAMLSLGGLMPYFDGNSPDNGAYDFGWEGTENASESHALPQTSTDYDPLVDPDCPRPPAAPRPPLITDDCIEGVGTWQRYWAVIPESVVTEWLTMVPTIALRIGATAAHQVRVRIYPNPDNLTPEGFNGEWSSEQIVSYLPPNSVMLIDGVDQRAWATVEDGPRLRADHLLYGSNGEPATWPVLQCGIGYLASFDVPEDTPSGNLEVEIALTQRRSA